MGKTESIKQRSIYVYLPSLDIVKDWKAKAKKTNVSIPQFVIEHVDNFAASTVMSTSGGFLYLRRNLAIVDFGEISFEEGFGIVGVLPSQPPMFA
jgi:hypothetical protein